MVGRWFEVIYVIFLRSRLYVPRRTRDLSLPSVEGIVSLIGSACGSRYYSSLCLIDRVHVELKGIMFK